MKSTLKLVATILAAAFGTLTVAGLIKKPGSVYRDTPEARNPMQGKRVRFVSDASDEMNADGIRGHLEELTPDTSAAFTSSESMMNGGKNGENSKNGEQRKLGIYEKYIKRGLDIVLSFCGLVVLSPVYAVIAVWIWIDDPGSVLFVQKRVGQNKAYFKLHKFRSMRMDTPHDVPTHQLTEPEKWITSVGRVLRRTSLDELPQIWDIWLGNMSVVGPRPALWNQDLLVSCRDQYGANDCVPGLTGAGRIIGTTATNPENTAFLAVA